MHTLEVRDYSIFVRLGCSEEERRIPQEVRLGMRLSFLAPPLACVSDTLSDTICYADLCARACEVATARDFHTIENLFAMIDKNLRALLGDSVSFTLRVHKVKPPVEGLLGGVVYGSTHPRQMEDV